jgi:peptidoglycan hydrolase-like protein with peptidoglycan-binding domain
MYEQQDDDEMIDTAPPGTYPDEMVSFSAGEDDGPERPEGDEDEPWDEFDAEALEELYDTAVSFGGPVALEDESTYERWLQSALKALVVHDLDVDGELGPRTRVAVKAFQRRAGELRAGAPKLTADGIAGPRTIAELELQTQSKAPGKREEDNAEVRVVEDEPTAAVAAPAQQVPTAAPVGGSDLRVSEEQVDGTTEYVITDGRDTVRFSYWTEDYKKYKPYNVSRYRGARKGLVSDADILAAGYSKSEMGILKANALKESGGAFGAINTWDDQIVSWGMAQFAGHAGTLAALLADLKADARSKAAYARLFVANGIDVDYGQYPWKDKTKTGWHIVVATDKGLLRGDDGWRHVRTQPRMIGAFLLAGNDPTIQLGQMLFWRRAFLQRAIQKVIGKKDDGSSKGAPVARYLTSERGLALIVRLYNWMPAHVVTWSNKFLAELQQRHAGVDVHDPSTWDLVEELERAFAQMIADERKRVKSGSYDTYALDLSRQRGSFVSPRSAT